MARSLVSFAVVVLVGLVVVKVLVAILEPRMAFYPLRGLDATPRQLGIPYQEIALETTDGERVYSWLLAHPAPRAEVLFWHGNGGNLSIWLDVIADIHDQGFTVLALDYRGYGKSTGRPTEEGVYRDSEAVTRYFWETLHDSGNKVLYWGRSLGATVAAYATTLAKPDGLILEAPFSDKRSLLRHYPLLALLGLFSSYRFPTAEFLRGFDRPVLVVHGGEDQVIPFEAGKDLFDRLETSKRFVAIPSAGHDDLHAVDRETYRRAVREFTEGLGGNVSGAP